MPTLIQTIANALTARANCQRTGNTEWFARWTDTLTGPLTDALPHGSGINGENTIDLDRSTPDKVVIHTAFHHMDENGYYDGWTQHTVTIRPAFEGLHVTISGPDRNGIKDDLAIVFLDALLESYDATNATPIEARA